MFYDSPTMLKQNLLRNNLEYAGSISTVCKAARKTFLETEDFFCRHDPFSFVYEWKHGSKRMDGLLIFIRYALWFRLQQRQKRSLDAMIFYSILYGFLLNSGVLTGDFV